LTWDRHPSSILASSTSAASTAALASTAASAASASTAVAAVTSDRLLPSCGDLFPTPSVSEDGPSGPRCRCGLVTVPGHPVSVLPAAAILQEEPFQRGQVQAELGSVVRRVVHQAQQAAAGRVHVEDVQTARVLLERVEAGQARAQDVREDG